MTGDLTVYLPSDYFLASASLLCRPRPCNDRSVLATGLRLPGKATLTPTPLLEAVSPPSSAKLPCPVPRYSFQTFSFFFSIAGTLCSPEDETNWNVLCSSPTHPHSFCGQAVAPSGHVVRRLRWSKKKKKKKLSDDTHNPPPRAFLILSVSAFDF